MKIDVLLLDGSSIEGLEEYEWTSCFNPFIGSLLTLDLNEIKDAGRPDVALAMIGSGSSEAISLISNPELQVLPGILGSPHQVSWALSTAWLLPVLIQSQLQEYLEHPNSKYFSLYEAAGIGPITLTNINELRSL